MKKKKPPPPADAEPQEAEPEEEDDGIVLSPKTLKVRVNKLIDSITFEGFNYT